MSQATYRTPQLEREDFARVEKQPTHMQRIHSATSMVLAQRADRLGRSLEIDIPTRTSRLQKLVVWLFGEELAARPAQETQAPMNLRQLIKTESHYGAQIFGAFPAYDRREFYCFDERMWIWHEERMNPQTGKHDVTTVSYNLSDMGILKSYGENESRFVQGEELEHFTAATEEYASKVYNELYLQDQSPIESTVVRPRNQDDYTLAA